MTTLREAAQQALEALESLFTLQMNYILLEQREDAISALKAALEQPETRNQCGETCERAKLCAVCARGLEEQEPVAWASKRELARIKDFDSTIYANGGFDGAVPLYTAPPRREWQGLSEQERHRLWRKLGEGEGIDEYAEAIEQALKEKNND
jgi:hypothetical protein